MSNNSLLEATMSGLYITLSLSFFSLLISVVPGTMLFMGRNSKSVLLKLPCSIYMHIFDGIPFLLQIFIIYYALPITFPFIRIRPFTSALVALSLNASAHLALVMHSHWNINKAGSTLKLLSLSAVYELAEIIKNSVLLSIIAILELFRSLSFFERKTGSNNSIFIAALIFLGLNILLKLFAKILRNTLFKEQYSIYGQ